MVRFGSEVVAERRASKRVSVQYLLVPSARAVVVVPAMIPETLYALAYLLTEPSVRALVFVALKN